MIIIEKRRWRGVRLVVSVVVLLVLLAGAGFAYTYFYGPEAKPVETTRKPQAPAKTPLTAPVVDPNSPVGVAMQSLTSPTTPGTNASLTIKTRPMATCAVVVAYGTQVVQDSGLAPHKADEFGVANWSWTIDPNAPLGSWPVKINCAFGKKSGTLTVTQTLAKEAAVVQ